MKVLNIGATAIGTAINVAPYYLANISYELSKVAGISLKQADDLIDATQQVRMVSKISMTMSRTGRDQPSGSSIISTQ